MTRIILIGAAAAVCALCVNGQRAIPACRLAPEDEAAIRAIIRDDQQDKANPNIATNLDWENGFGIRYNDAQKMRAFYSKNVSPLQKGAAAEVLEVRIKMLNDATAVADAYWRLAGQLDAETQKPGPDRWGRTTYVMEKVNSRWTLVVERCADLKLPYFQHFSELPKAFPAPAAKLAAYAGNYESATGKLMEQVKVEGDHLLFVFPKPDVLAVARVAIPVSETEFLLFDPADLAEYHRVQFTRDAWGKDAVLFLSETGEPGPRDVRAN
jgi:hypothetical protein